MASETLPAKVAFTYNDVDVAYDANRMLNLTQMWEAQGSPVNRDPSQWRKTKEADGFIRSLAESQNVAITHVFRSMRGRGNKGVWGHYQIALAYAKYLSHEFHRHVNEAFREWSEEKADPGLKIERGVAAYLRQGKELDWIERRFKGISARKALCSTMADHNCKVRGKDDNPFAEITRAISLKVLGKTPGEIREDKGLAKSAPTRDSLDEDDLISLEWAEVQARKLIKGEALDGNEECVDAGRRAGAAIRSAIDTLSKKTG